VPHSQRRCVCDQLRPDVSPYVDKFNNGIEWSRVPSPPKGLRARQVATSWKRITAAQISGEEAVDVPGDSWNGDRNPPRQTRSVPYPRAPPT
jgi:hypothetical protein